ncbi:MAG: bacterial regulatory helix-turn-helix, lysR family protein [Rhizorhabdus sp.]|nr:bacterial regulatory helix-turn-helix, lysR family protein [Rhizorhabdus sp.]
MLDWDSLRFFIAIVREGTPAAAARRMHVNESTVRRRLVALETLLDARLFDRVGGEYRLTMQGQALVPSAEAVEKTVTGIFEMLRGADSRVNGRVSIGAPHGLGCLCIAPALAMLQHRLPELTIELITLPRSADMGRQEVDVAIVPDRPETGAHRVRALPPLAVGLYASRDYLDAHPPITGVDSLKGHKLVGYSEYDEFARPLAVHETSLGLTKTPDFASSNVMAQARAAACGAGLTLLPRYAAEPHLGLVSVLPDQVRMMVPLWLLIHQNVAPLARVRAVVDALVGLAPWTERRGARPWFRETEPA